MRLYDISNFAHIFKIQIIQYRIPTEPLLQNRAQDLDNMMLVRDHHIQLIRRALVPFSKRRVLILIYANTLIHLDLPAT